LLEHSLPMAIGPRHMFISVMLFALVVGIYWREIAPWIKAWYSRGKARRSGQL